MAKKLTILFSLFLCVYASAQTSSSIVNQLSSELQVVENIKTKISQTVKEVQPGLLQLEMTFTNIKDGKSVVESYEFNMADIDLNTIRSFTNKDVIQVQLLAAKKQKVIKKTTDNTKVKFEEEVFVYAKNIDNGRNLVDIFKSLVPVSIDIVEKRLSLKTFQDHIDWLVNNVKTVTLENKQFVQKITQNSKYASKLEFSVDEVANQKSVNTTYVFNLANINPNSVFAEVKGDFIEVNLDTKRKLKTVKTLVATEQKDYKNNLSIYCESIEKSRDLQKVLKGIIALAEDKIENAVPKIKNVSEGLANINDYIKTVTVNNVAYNQNIVGDCVATINLKESTPSKTTDESFTLNFKDLAKNLVKYDTSGKNVYVEIQTKGGKNFLKHVVNQELKNYDKSVRFEFSEVEDAIISAKLFETIIEKCEAAETKLVGTKKDLLNQVKSTIKKVTINTLTYEQSLEIQDNNILLFKSTEVTPKNSKSKVYEFNMKDINPANLNFNTSGTTVFVTLNTNYSEKIIKYYEDGAIKNYQNTIDIQATDIEEARLISDLFKKILNQ
ncbi:hypothetical protein [Flavobacterium capsici]|uniref:Uncharacterized protein n=1 Tax=Flavobacterium capsici TaxID=3075618 RepID=A0AA96ETF6_9FLAO|nr:MULTISPECIES: hypothetical protein [unclassified Flavobacterium]WNM17859.1 hypothetical protein RN608_07515 [Flavobacterium sp. PMR2A8]WNM21912.1 hypothetical protein RN605_00815 [Flavobacterium sp. PMTSA4]